MESYGTLAQIEDNIRNAARTQETKASYLARQVRLQQASNTVAGLIISDTAEISQSAMNKFLSEIKG